MVDARGLLWWPRPPRQTECGLGTGLSARRAVLNAGAYLAACLCNPSEPASEEVIDKQDTGRAMGTLFPIRVPLRTRRDTGSRRVKGCLGATLANCQAAVIHPPAIAPLAFPTQASHARNVFGELHLPWVAESLLCRPLTLSQPAARVVRCCDVLIGLPGGLCLGLECGGRYWQPPDGKEHLADTHGPVMSIGRSQLPDSQVPRPRKQLSSSTSLIVACPTCPPGAS